MSKNHPDDNIYSILGKLETIKAKDAPKPVVETAPKAKSRLVENMETVESKLLREFKEGDLKEGAKVDRFVKHVKDSEVASGKSGKKATDIAWATANKRGMLDNKNKVDETQLDEIDRLAGDYGAWRSGAEQTAAATQAAAAKPGAKWNLINPKNNQISGTYNSQGEANAANKQWGGAFKVTPAMEEAAPNVTKHTGKYGTSYYDSPEHTGDEEGAGEKRGRGRPKKADSERASAALPQFKGGEHKPKAPKAAIRTHSMSDAPPKGSPEYAEYAAKQARAAKRNKGKVKEEAKVTKHTGTYGTSYYSSPEHTGDEPAAKQGRGRPKKAAGEKASASLPFSSKAAIPTFGKDAGKAAPKVSPKAVTRHSMSDAPPRGSPEYADYAAKQARSAKRKGASLKESMQLLAQRLIEGVNFRKMAEETHQSIDKLMSELQKDIAHYKATGHCSENLKDFLQVHQYSQKVLDNDVASAVVEEPTAPTVQVAPQAAPQVGMMDEEILGHNWWGDYHEVPGYAEGGKHKGFYHTEIDPENYGYEYTGRRGGLSYLSIKSNTRPGKAQIKRYLDSKAKMLAGYGYTPAQAVQDRQLSELAKLAGLEGDDDLSAGEDFSWDTVGKPHAADYEPEHEVVDEGGMSELDLLMQDLGTGEADIYDVMTNPKTRVEQAASKMLQDMYNEVSIDSHLHPDDDFEDIINIMADQIAKDHPAVAEEGIDVAEPNVEPVNNGHRNEYKTMRQSTMAPGEGDAGKKKMYPGNPMTGDNRMSKEPTLEEQLMAEYESIKKKLA